MGLCSSGKTTLSASGFLLPDTLYDAEVAKRLCGHNDGCRVLVVTVASVIEPFLSLQHRENFAEVEKFVIYCKWVVDVIFEVGFLVCLLWLLCFAGPAWVDSRCSDWYYGRGMGIFVMVCYLGRQLFVVDLLAWMWCVNVIWFAGKIGVGEGVDGFG